MCEQHVPHAVHMDYLHSAGGNNSASTTVCLPSAATATTLYTNKRRNIRQSNSPIAAHSAFAVTPSAHVNITILYVVLYADEYRRLFVRGRMFIAAVMLDKASHHQGSVTLKPNGEKIHARNTKMSAVLRLLVVTASTTTTPTEQAANPYTHLLPEAHIRRRANSLEL